MPATSPRRLLRPANRPSCARIIGSHARRWSGSPIDWPPTWRRPATNGARFMATISNNEFEAAKLRAEGAQARFPATVAVHYDRRIANIVIELSTGLKLAFSPRVVQGLEQACPADLVDAQISPSGLGIHFPHLDADLYVPGLLEGLLGSRTWMAAEQGRRGGRKKSDAKATAARANGKLGGRPKKTTAG